MHSGMSQGARPWVRRATPDHKTGKSHQAERNHRHVWQRLTLPGKEAMLSLFFFYGRENSTGQGNRVLGGGGLWPGGHTVAWDVVSGEVRWEIVFYGAKTQDSGNGSLSRMDFHLLMIKG